MIIDYKILNKETIKDVRNIDRSDYVNGIYKVIDDKLVLTDELFNHQGFTSEDYEEVIKELTSDLDNGAIFIGAYDNNSLVGISGFTTTELSDYKNLYNFGPLWISKRYRRQGLAKKLLLLTIDKAKDYDVDGFYISATPSKNTLGFYLKMGCELVRPDKELYELEPEDIHLKLLFSKIKKIA